MARSENGYIRLLFGVNPGLYDGSDRPTQPKKKTHPMNHAGDTHQMKIGVFSRRVSLKLKSSDRC